MTATELRWRTAGKKTTLIEERKAASDAGQTEKVKYLKKEIEKQAKKDKMNAQLEELKEADEQGYKWEGLKTMKRKANPKFCKFKNKDGK